MKSNTNKPKKQPKRKRPAIIKAHVSLTEKRQVEALAKSAGLSINDLIRFAVLRECSGISMPKVDPQITRQIAMVGNLLNQLARLGNYSMKAGRAIDIVKFTNELRLIRNRME